MVVKCHRDNFSRWRSRGNFPRRLIIRVRRHFWMTNYGEWSPTPTDPLRLRYSGEIAVLGRKRTREQHLICMSVPSLGFLRFSYYCCRLYVYVLYVYSVILSHAYFTQKQITQRAFK